MRRILYFLLLAPVLLLAPTAWAAGQGTPDEAKAMAVKAAEYLKSAGPDQAFAAFDAKNGPWHDRDLYVLVLGDDNVMYAHGTNPGLIGKSLATMKDVDGNPMNAPMLAVKGADWVRYKWQNPITKAVEPKVAYCVRVGEYVVVVGAYAN
jgi:signal transduction histidine kinase